MGFIQRVREARRIAQPPQFSPSITDPPYRLISIYPSLLFARLGVTPNQITVLWAILGLAGVVAVGAPAYSARVAGAILFQISYLLDYVDGEVARLQSRSSKRGFLLDLLAHGLIKSGLFLALGYRDFRTTQDTSSLLLAFLACVSIVNVYALPFLAEHAGVRNQPGTSTSSERPARHRSRLREFVGLSGLLFESPGLYALTLVALLIDRIHWLLLFYGVLTPVWLLWRLRKYRYE